MIGLIDTDIVAYRCSASAEKESEKDIAIWRCDDLMHSILHNTGSTEYEAYLSGQTNYRKRIDPEYKANRIQPRPKWLELCREHLVTKWSARVCDDIEADDGIGIAQSYYFDAGIPSVVCSIDKDFFQLPGKHYQWEISGTTAKGTTWVKEEQHIFVTPLDGIRTFYRHLLIGDTSDNIVGVDRIGKTKAHKYIDHLTEEMDMYEVVQSLYKDDERLEKNCQLVWILRKENTRWSSPITRKQEMETQQLSSDLPVNLLDPG